jgi:hypothetical protein
LGMFEENREPGHPECEAARMHNSGRVIISKGAPTGLSASYGFAIITSHSLPVSAQ